MPAPIRTARTPTANSFEETSNESMSNSRSSSTSSPIGNSSSFSKSVPSLGCRQPKSTVSGASVQRGHPRHFRMKDNSSSSNRKANRRKCSSGRSGIVLVTLACVSLFTRCSGEFARDTFHRGATQDRARKNFLTPLEGKS